jgi:hypothetical protein
VGFAYVLLNTVRARGTATGNLHCAARATSAS